MPPTNSPESLARSVSARRSTNLQAPKLRDSCLACASSKVKCSKEKPTCVRCAKRGLSCEYCVTKRAGRKHDVRSNDVPKVTAAPRPSSSTSSELGALTSPNFIQPSSCQHASDYPEIWPSLLSPENTASTSPISFPEPDFSDLDILTQPFIDTEDADKGSLDFNGSAALFNFEDGFSIIDETASSFPILSKPLSLPTKRDSTSSDAQSFQDVLSDSPCCCLVRALGLFKQLFPNASTTCSRLKEQGYENATSQTPTIQSVVVENEQTIEAISKMLQCSCSQDGYLLAITSLIVFKVLGWYAAAAHETRVTNEGQDPSESHASFRRDSSVNPEQVLHCPTVVGGYRIDGEDQGRMAAQLVLSELHRVQRLVNLLSQRLKGHGVRSGAVGLSKKAIDGQSDGQRTPPFSATMLDHLEADLRKRLRALTMEIVDMLRRG
ncbi:MAG: hypothetical protein Q9225_004083 [Loekoesia sp. 1 TL-2023]